MSDRLYLAWQYLRHHRVITIILVASITLILYLPAARSLQDWHRLIQIQGEQDVASNMLLARYQPRLQVLGDHNLILPGTPI